MKGVIFFFLKELMHEQVELTVRFYCFYRERLKFGVLEWMELFVIDCNKMNARVRFRYYVLWLVRKIYLLIYNGN